MKPAMTGEEWEIFLATEPKLRFEWARDVALKGGFRGSHDLAARALYGNSFGFTHEHLALLTAGIEAIRACKPANAMGIEMSLGEIQERIKALLPPAA